MWILFLIALAIMGLAGYGFITVASYARPEPRVLTGLLVIMVVLAFITGSLAEKVLP